MAPQTSKKAEALKGEVKKLEDTAKKKIHAIDRAEKMLDEKMKNELMLINLELDKFKNKTNDVLSGKAEDTGWDEQAVRVSEMMKMLVEEESRQQHDLFVKADEAATELELKAKPIRKELPMVSDFSEEDRIHILHAIDKFLHKIRDKLGAIESLEAKLNRKMQVLMENTPDPTEDKTTILSKLQVSYDVVSGLNDPDRARDELLKRLSTEHSGSSPQAGGTSGAGAKKISKTPTPIALPNKRESNHSVDGHSPGQQNNEHPAEEQHPDKPRSTHRDKPSPARNVPKK